MKIDIEVPETEGGKVAEIGDLNRLLNDVKQKKIAVLEESTAFNKVVIVATQNMIKATDNLLFALKVALANLDAKKKLEAK